MPEVNPHDICPIVIDLSSQQSIVFEADEFKAKLLATAPRPIDLDRVALFPDRINADFLAYLRVASTDHVPFS